MSSVASPRRSVAFGLPRAGSITRRVMRARDDRTRIMFAEGLERAVHRAGQPQPAFSSAIPVSRAAGGGAAGVLLDLAERLRHPRRVDPDGMRQVRRLLTDGVGPLYCGSADELGAAARAALLALDGDVTPD